MKGQERLLEAKLLLTHLEARLLLTCFFLAIGVGLPGVYPGGVLPGAGEGKEEKGGPRARRAAPGSLPGGPQLLQTVATGVLMGTVSLSIKAQATDLR